MEAIDKSPEAVSGMFSRIARRYDLLNHLLSFNADRRWRRAAARAAARAPEGPILDLATGTGDLLAAIRAAGRKAAGADFCLEMVALAPAKLAESAPCPVVAADALALPFSSKTFAAVAIAFGVRNFASLPAGLSEIVRVLRPGGRAVILEFSQPAGLFARLYRFHSDVVLPAVGGLVSGDRDAYRYLNRSARAWPGPEEFSGHLRRAGLSEVRWRPLSMGIVALHEGVRA